MCTRDDTGEGCDIGSDSAVLARSQAAWGSLCYSLTRSDAGSGQSGPLRSARGKSGSEPGGDQDRLPPSGLDPPPGQKPGRSSRLSPFQRDQRELPGLVRPAAPQHVRPHRPPRRRARLAVRRRGAVRGRGRRHQRHRVRRDPGRPPRRLRRRQRGQGGHQARPRDQLRGGGVRLRKADAVRARDALRRLPRDRLGAGIDPRDLRRLQRPGESAVPARHLADRCRADLLALPRNRAHRERSLPGLPRERARDLDEHARGHDPAGGRVRERRASYRGRGTSRGPTRRRGTSRSRSRCARIRSSDARGTT